MEGWKECRLGDLLEINSESIGRNYKFKEINYFDISSVKSGQVEKIDTIDLKNAPSRAKRIVRKKDTILSTVRPRNRSFFYFKEAKENDVVSTGFAVLIPNQKLIDDRYLYYLVTDYSFTEFLVSNEKGATYPAVTTDVIERAKIHLPPLPTQRKIAKILSAYDDLIENNLKRIKLLEEMAQISYEEWFVRMKFPGHEHAVFDEETGLPEGWERVKLGEVAKLNKQSLRNDFTGDILYIDIAGVSPNRINSKTKYEFSKAPGRARRIVEHGDIIWSCVRPNRKSHAVIWHPEKNLIASTGFCVISPEKLPTSYLYQFLTTDSYVGYLSNLAGGAAYPAVKPIHFQESEIIFPNAELISKYDSIYGNSLEISGNLQKQNQGLKEARDILLPRLMTGMIDVEELSVP